MYYCLRYRGLYASSDVDWKPRSETILKFATEEEAKAYIRDYCHENGIQIVRYMGSIAK